MKPMFSKLPIANKIMLVVVLGMALAVLLTSIAMNYYDSRVQEEQFLKNHRLLAQIMAQSSAAPIAFLDRRRAQEELDGLLPASSIQYACLFSSQVGKVLAEIHTGQGHRCAPQLSELQIEREKTLMRISYPITRKDVPIGALFMVVSRADLDKRRQDLTYIIVLAALASCLVSIILVNRFQRLIANPIERLNTVARAITEGRDWSLRAERFSDDELGELVDSFNDMVNLLEEDQKKLERMAYYDPLTKLPNRRLLEERLSRAIARGRRNRSRYAVCFIDLDDFKAVNDSLGHDSGDQLLRELAKRVSTIIRKDDTLARFGGDEFVIVLEGLKDDQQLDILCCKVLQVMSEPMSLCGNEYRCNATIGVAIGEPDNASMYTLMKQADIALYEAKKAGKNDYRIYNSTMAGLAPKEG
ncbi:diguanylate cyclase domain-containing protein [Agaribacterium sp. ZY112]|uniref:diguanylate cyclase domain-containing protein n=1 Tax=Agaribacterium sp. ZY112 TaxID=3233574 RepID=UPI0035246DDB